MVDLTSSTYDVSIWRKSKILTENVPNYFKVFALLTQEVEAITRYNYLQSCKYNTRCTSYGNYYLHAINSNAPAAPDGRCFPVARSVTLSTLFNLADRNRICLNGGTPNDVQAGQWQTSFSGRGDAHRRRTVNKFQRPSILQLNIEGLTASKMSVLHHLALQCEALVILLQETHCTSVERLDLPSYHLAGFSLSRKHGLATFVHERLKWILIDQSPPTSEIEWVCVDVDNYKVVNVYKPPPTRMQASDLPAFPHPCLYAGDFNCHHVDWGYDNNNPDGECLDGWASANNFTLLYSPKEAASVSTLAAGKHTPTQILHLPVSIWTVAYLTDVS